MILIADTLGVILMFGLRIGIPLLFTAGLVYLLKRLDRRWEAEARAARDAGKAVVLPIGRPAQRPAIAPGQSLPVIPFVPPVQPGMVALQPSLQYEHCWDWKECSEQAKTKCAAPQHAEQPCWQARFDAEGRVPDQCAKCEMFLDDVFQHYPLM